jgi:hypothetical protein
VVPSEKIEVSGGGASGAKRSPGRAVRPQRERGHDPEVAAPAAAAGPEQVVIRVGVHVAYAAVRGHDARREQVVTREAEAPARKPVPAAEREAGNADRRARAGWHGHPSARERALHVDQLRGRPHRGAPAREPHASQLRQVEHHAFTRGGIARIAVATRAGHDAHVEAVRPAHRRRHVGGALDVDDSIRPAPLEAAVVDDRRSVARHDDPAPDGGPQLAQCALGDARRLRRQAQEDRAAGSAYQELATVELAHPLIPADPCAWPPPPPRLAPRRRASRRCAGGASSPSPC